MKDAIVFWMARQIAEFLWFAVPLLLIVTGVGGYLALDAVASKLNAWVDARR